MTWERIGQRAVGAFALFLLVVALLVILPTLMESWMPTEAKGLEKWTFWLQTVSGNWNGTSGIVNRWWFAFSAVIAILLNNSLIFVVGTLIWRWNVERLTAMKLSQAFTVRDQMNKQAIFDKLPPDQHLVDIVNAAFADGEKRWVDELNLLFGEKETNRLKQMLSKEI